MDFNKLGTWGKMGNEFQPKEKISKIVFRVSLPKQGLPLKERICSRRGSKFFPLRVAPILEVINYCKLFLLRATPTVERSNLF